jgi:hypothetical protein
MWLEGDQVPSGCCSMCRSSLERCRASRLAWPTKPSSDLVVSWGQFERPTPVHTKHLDFGFSSMIWDMFLYFSFSFWIFVISWVQGSIQLVFFFSIDKSDPWSCTLVTLQVSICGWAYHDQFHGRAVHDVHSQALRNRVATLALFRVAALGSSVFFWY